MKGQRLLDDINTIRAVQGFPPLSSIRLDGCDLRDPASCAVALATNSTVARGIADAWRKSFTLRFARGYIARMVGVALDRPFAEDTREVLAPDTMRSFVIAASYGLVFKDAHGLLRGWIEPTADDPSVWDLQLMPGDTYPKGHGPRPNFAASRRSVPHRRAPSRGMAGTADALVAPAVISAGAQ